MCEIDFEYLFNSNEIKLKNQKINKTLSVNAFKILKTKFGESYLCFSDRCIRIFYANSQLKSYLSKLKQDLKVEDGYYYKDEDLSKIVEFKIKVINEVNGQVELEILKNKKSINKNTDEVLELTDDEKDNKPIIKDVKTPKNEKDNKPVIKDVKTFKNKSKMIDHISDEITNEILNTITNKK